MFSYTVKRHPVCCVAHPTPSLVSASLVVLFEPRGEQAAQPLEGVEVAAGIVVPEVACLVRVRVRVFRTRVRVMVFRVRVRVRVRVFRVQVRVRASLTLALHHPNRRTGSEGALSCATFSAA